MTMSCRSFLILFLQFIQMGSCGQEKVQSGNLSPAFLNEIDGLFSSSSLLTPGYAIGIVKGEKTLYAKGYGSANLDYSIPITTSSSFDIASVSKQFTAAAIALLIMDKEINLEAPAFDYVPELKKYRDTIRIKHLLYNTSGIIDYHRLPRKNGKSWITFYYFDVDECIATSLSQDSLSFKPGTKWDYCNVNFMLLTKIVEKQSGVSFSNFLKNRLFDPLQMNSSFVHDDITRVVKNRVTPYNRRTKDNMANYKQAGITVDTIGEWMQHPRNSPHYGGSGIVTTVEDLIKWSSNFFTKKFGGIQFYDLMHTRLTFSHSRKNQAFGLYFGKYKDRDYVAWDGGDWGISSQLIRFPMQQVAIIVLSNDGNGEAFRKAEKIAEMLIAAGVL